MMFQALLWVFVCSNTIFVKNVWAVTVTFTIKSNHPDQAYCGTSSDNVTLNPGDFLRLNVTAALPHLSLIGDNFVAYCVLKNKQNHFFTEKDFRLTLRDNVKSAKIIASKAIEGTWQCPFQIKTKTDSPIAMCVLNVIVAEPSKKIEPIPELYYWIGGGVGAILIILIAQTIIIIRYKNKIKSQRVSKRLSRSQPTRDDPTRYSTMPGERKRSNRRQREDSAIYQSLENICVSAPKSPIGNRPPMPLPIEYDDTEHIYDDGNTLNLMFAPEPSPVETLPRKHIKKDKAPLFQMNSIKTVKPPVKPKPPVQEDYDYPDTTELLKSNNKPSKENSLPLPPKAGKGTPEPPSKARKGTAEPPPVATKSKPHNPHRPPGGTQIVNELQNRFRIPIKPAPEVPRLVPEPSIPIAGPSGFRPPGPKPQLPKSKHFHAPDPTPQVPLQAWPQENVPQSTFRAQRFPPPNNARSPPVSRVQPMPQIPPVVVKPPPIKTKPLPPSPVIKSPPTPIQDELYEEVPNPDASSDDEWSTFDKLTPYNIYNV